MARPPAAAAGFGRQRARHRRRAAARRQTAPRAVMPPRADRPTRLEQLRRARSRASAAAPAGDQQRHHHVLERGELAQQVMELEHEADRAVPDLRQAPRSPACTALARDANFARRRPVERAQHVQQRALPGAALADDRHHLAARTVSDDAVEHADDRRRRRRCTPSTHVRSLRAPACRPARHSWRIASTGNSRAACRAG